MKNIILVVSIFIFTNLSYAKIEDTSICKASYIVTATELNVRSEPHVKSGIVKTVKKNAIVCVSAFENNWAQINSGWVYLKYIIKNEKTSETNLSTDDYIGGIVIILSFIFMFFWGMHGMILSFRDKHYLNIILYTASLIFYVLYLTTSSNTTEKVLASIAMVIVLFYLSSFVTKLPSCDNCGYTKMTKTNQVLLDQEVKRNQEGKLQNIKKFSSEYRCLKCGEYSEKIETVTEDIY